MVNVMRFAQRFRRDFKNQLPKSYRSLFRVEMLEDRSVPATFAVTSLLDNGPGTLRQAITDANSTTGADTLTFSIAGTITLASALPTITDEVTIDGSTAPGFTATPVVEVDYNGNSGLVFGAQSQDSILRSLGHINASGAGVTVGNPQIGIYGNFMGLKLDGVTVAGNTGAGLELTKLAIRSIIGTVTVADRNVISGNGGDGILFDGGFENKVVANFIGTDKTGALDRGNGGNGVLVTNAASNNVIGGVTPAAAKFTVIAPEGNVISGNALNGILITNGSVNNLVAANFVGTNLAGNAAVGNTLDGIAVTKASNNNSILGTFVNTIPFIFMNLSSGNGGNGIRVSDSNNTIIHANVTGLTANNDSKLGNGLNGVLIEGTSANTTYGGIIPLGNVSAGNTLNGVVVADTANGFTAFNTFAGVNAFTQQADLGNKLDGFLITSTGGNNVLRTNVISANGDDGVEISGAATGVTLVQNIIGLSTNGAVAIGNVGNGVAIRGTAHDNIIGGPQGQFSVIPHNAISGNGANGIAVLDTAINNAINFSFIGSDIKGLTAVPNAQAGIFLGTGSSKTIIGSTNPAFATMVSGNSGVGIQMTGTNGNSVVTTIIGLDKDSAVAMPNGGDGINITNSSNNLIGTRTTGTGNTIASNGGNGVAVVSGNGNGVLQNSITANGLLGIDVTAGANNNQAAPHIISALLLSDGIRVSGTVTAAANTFYTVEFFTDTAADPSGTGEGKTLLGTLPVRTDGTGIGRFTFITSVPAAGNNFITATATDSSNNSSEFSENVNFNTALLNVPGASVNGGILSLFGAIFDSETRIVTADFTGDGVTDLAAATGPGAVSLVRVIDGATATEIFNIVPFGSTFLGGLFISAGDVTADGKADLAITAGAQGGPRVRIFQGGTFAQINDFFGIDDVNYRGGTTSAIGDVNGDGTGDLIITTGVGGGPRVAIFNGKTLSNASPSRLTTDFFAYDSSLRSGLYVAAGDVNGDGKADLVFGAGTGGGPQVRILDGAKLTNGTAVFNANGSVSGADLANFFARSSSDRSGLRVTVNDLDGDGKADVITRADNSSGHDAVAFLGKSLTLGVVEPKTGLDGAFDDYANAIFVG
ncbi:hypothetical protein BH11PLA2_BH11PLA2_16780 [soil metagenome]